jgi:hypothetical protein
MIEDNSENGGDFNKLIRAPYLQKEERMNRNENKKEYLIK